MYLHCTHLCPMAVVNRDYITDYRSQPVIMLEPSSSEEDSDVENDTWLTRTSQNNTDTSLKPPAPHQNGGLRSGSPHVVDGSKPGQGGVKPIDRAGSPSPSVSSEKTLTGAELAVGDQ